MRIAMVGLRGLPARGGCIQAMGISENRRPLGDCGLYLKGDDVYELYALICRYLRSDSDRCLERSLRLTGKNFADRRSDPELISDRLEILDMEAIA